MLAITSTWYVVESVLKSENARLWGSGLLNGRFNELLKQAQSCMACISPSRIHSVCRISDAGRWSMLPSNSEVDI